MTARPTNAVIFLGLMHEAWVSIGASPLRTFLAVLGIIIGVGSVVLMLAIGEGSRRAVQEAVNSLGRNLLIVTPGGFTSKGLRTADFGVLDMKDASAIAQLPAVVAAAPTTSGRALQAIAGKLNWNVIVVGTTPDYFLVRNRSFSEGQSFTGQDVAALARVAVIGSTIAEKLFPGEIKQGRSLIGATIQINNVPFHVIGVLTPKGPGYDGRDQDNMFYLPITTAKSRLWGNIEGENIIRVIYVKAVSGGALDEATDEIASQLRARHRLHETEGDNFTISNMVSIMQVASETTRALSLLLGAIASISLVVGAIGIMNIMLVTVAERTREIGIRKAIGATGNHILLQFLMEAVMIAAMGSLAGLALGFGGGLAAERWFFLSVEYSPWSVVLALIVAAMVGILSGLYPAYKAAKLQPIEALHTPGT